MKNFKIPSWALIISITLSSTAFGDVCQKDSAARIRMAQEKGGSWSITYATGEIGPPAMVGPQTTFTPAELDKKRLLDNEAVAKIGARDAGAVLGFLALLAIVGSAGPGDATTLRNAESPAPGPSPTELAEASVAKEELTVLDKSLFTASPVCTYVPSIDKHVEILGRVLGSIYGQRFKQASVSAPKVEGELKYAKTAPADASETKAKTDAPVDGTTTPAN